jgi:hypothetical protein
MSPAVEAGCERIVRFDGLWAILDGDGGVSERSGVGRAVVPALQCVGGVRVVAAIVTACLLSSGCSPIVKQPSDDRDDGANRGARRALPPRARAQRGRRSVSLTRATAAIVAAALLSQSACSLVPTVPKRAARRMDIGLAIVGAISLPLVACEIEGGNPEDGCIRQQAALAFIGLPVLLGFGIWAGLAEEDKDEATRAKKSTETP